MHDEQPFCSNLTERRRTTVKFLGQQSEMLIDDTWPQQVRCEASGRARQSFGQVTCHKMTLGNQQTSQSHISALPQSFDRDTAAMFSLFQNPVASTEHECRDPNLPVVLHTENAEEEGSGFGVGKFLQCVQ